MMYDVKSGYCTALANLQQATKSCSRNSDAFPLKGASNGLCSTVLCIKVGHKN